MNCRSAAIAAAVFPAPAASSACWSRARSVVAVEEAINGRGFATTTPVACGSESGALSTTLTSVVAVPAA